MTTFFYSLVALLVITTPILFIIWLVRMAMKKKALKIGVATAICAGSIIPLAIIGALVNPATYCKHEYTVVEEVPATCKEKGQITRVCSLCNDKKTEKLKKPSIRGRSIPPYPRHVPKRVTLFRSAKYART